MILSTKLKLISLWCLTVSLCALAGWAFEVGQAIYGARDLGDIFLVFVLIVPLTGIGLSFAIYYGRRSAALIGGILAILYALTSLEAVYSYVETSSQLAGAIEKGAIQMIGTAFILLITSFLCFWAFILIARIETPVRPHFIINVIIIFTMIGAIIQLPFVVGALMSNLSLSGQDVNTNSLTE